MRPRAAPRGTGITPDTDFELVAIEDGRCVGIATKFHGDYGERENARMAEEWRSRGFEVITIRHDEAQPYLDSLRARCPVR